MPKSPDQLAEMLIAEERRFHRQFDRAMRALSACKRHRAKCRRIEKRLETLLDAEKAERRRKRKEREDRRTLGDDERIPFPPPIDADPEPEGY